MGKSTSGNGCEADSRCGVYRSQPSGGNLADKALGIPSYVWAPPQEVNIYPRFQCPCYTAALHAAVYRTVEDVVKTPMCPIITH